METRKDFIEQSEDFRFFSVKSEKEFYVHVIGYHNLRRVPALTVLRRQEYHTLHFVLAGKGTLILGNKKYDVEQNDVFYIDDKCTFAYFPKTEDPWEYVFFEFRGDFAEQYIAGTKLSRSNPVAHASDAQLIASMLFSTFSQEQTSYPYALSVFWLIMDSISEKNHSSKKRTQSDFIEDVKSYIRIKYLDSDFSIENLCKNKFISHSHLCRIFKSHENMSVVSYIKKMRLEYAASLLKSTDYSLKKISVMSGFKEYEYFFRSFKKQFGETPSVYRNG